MEKSKERKQVTLRIFRGVGSDRSKDRYEVFTVPYEDGMVVLNAIHYIQSHLDSSLSARWNCKAGHCGSCSAEINGWPRLMCKTPVADFDGDITIEPMKAFPLIRDLATDVSENYEIAKKIPPFTPKESKDEIWKMYQQDVDKGREFRKCIECFLCQDVCHVVREHKADYIGPRFIVKAASFDMHPFDKLDRSDYLKETARNRLLQHHEVLSRSLPGAHNHHRRRNHSREGKSSRYALRPDSLGLPQGQRFREIKSS